jgi:putative transposase
MAEYARGSHTIHDIKYHIVWITKYRYEVLTKKIAERLRELLIQGCESRGITIVEGSGCLLRINKIFVTIQPPTRDSVGNFVAAIGGNEGAFSPERL